MDPIVQAEDLLIALDTLARLIRLVVNETAWRRHAVAKATASLSDLATPPRAGEVTPG